MGDIRTEPRVGKLFFALLADSHDLIAEVRHRLELDYSPVETASDPVDFTHTRYYEGEMGPGLIRQWIGTQQPIFLPELVGTKRYTNQLEQFHGRDGRRRINIDPGYVTLSKVVLATTKDYDHRIYVRDGIYEEVTLHYRRSDGFRPWPWTYPDYQTDIALEFFRRVRSHLRETA